MSGKSLPVSGPSVSHPLPRILLVQPPVGGGPGDVTPPLGLLVLGGILEQRGRQVTIGDLNLRSKTGAFDTSRSIRSQLVKALPPKGSFDLIGITTWSYNFDVTMELVQEVRKKHKGVPIVLGGPHVTFVDEEVLATFPEVDYVIRDEGDWTFPRLIEVLEQGADPEALSTIAGLSWRRDGAIVRNPSGEVVEDLDALPFPAYHLIDPAEYLKLSPVLALEAGRGCPYNCNFCSTTNMFQRKYRVKSAARLVDELAWALQETGGRRFELLHDNLVASKKYVLALCHEIRSRNLDVEWSCTSRTDNITEEVAEAMFLAGCEQVFFGIESMSVERQTWTGKKLKPPKIEAAVALTARQHITPTMGIIVGFPDETEEEFDATVGAAFRWTTEPKIQGEVSTAVLRYYPGADLFQHADALRYDPLAAATAAALPGYTIRKGWRDKAHLFPLQMIHTSPPETRRNLARVHTIRTLLVLAPHTVRGAAEILGLGAYALLNQMQAGEPLGFLKDPSDKDRLANEVLRALGKVVASSSSDALREILAWEVPFWETLPVSPPLERLEHVIHPKRFVQDELLQHGWGHRADPPTELEAPRSIIGVRAGREVFVSITDDPQAVLRSFQQKLARLGLS